MPRRRVSRMRPPCGGGRCGRPRARSGPGVGSVMNAWMGVVGVTASPGGCATTLTARWRRCSRTRRRGGGALAWMRREPPGAVVTKGTQGGLGHSRVPGRCSCTEAHAGRPGAVRAGHLCADRQSLVPNRVLEHGAGVRRVRNLLLLRPSTLDHCIAEQRTPSDERRYHGNLTTYIAT